MDIVLLPDRRTQRIAVEASRQIVARGFDGIQLGRGGGVPHVSLCMGVLRLADRPAFEERLSRVARESRPLRLRAAGVEVRERPEGGAISILEIEPSAALRSLHEAVMDSFGGLLGSDARPEMFLGPPAIRERTIEWVRSYRKRSAFGRFRPHITFGLGELKDPLPPFEFEARRLAAFQLGNHCACLRLLACRTLAGPRASG